MRDWCAHDCHSGSYLDRTASTWVAQDKCNYLSNINYQLVNEINTSETEKYFYRNKLSHQYRNHTTELEQAFKIISEKNNTNLMIEQQLDRLKKQYRVLEGEYRSMKSNLESNKNYYELQKQNTERKCEQKIRKIEQKLEKQYELKIGKRVSEVTQQCQDRVKMYKNQIQELSENSNQLTHQLKMMQDKYREMLLKNDLMIQQSINRQLRKRDYEAQNNYLRDVSQFEAMVKDKRQLKQVISGLQDKNNLLSRQKSEVEALLEAEKTKYKDIAEAFEFDKKNRSLQIERTYAQKKETDTNTEQTYIPIVMPVDLDLMSEIVSIKQFVVQKIIQRFLEFFCKAAVTDPKKKSHSLITFKNNLEQLKSSNPENKILLYIQSSLDKIIKTYCPSMCYTRQFLTVKDQFIKKTLMECETISNPAQKLYRLLQLVHRLRHPATHQQSDISPGELRMLELKLMIALKKALQ